MTKDEAYKILWQPQEIFNRKVAEWLLNIYEFGPESGNWVHQRRELKQIVEAFEVIENANRLKSTE